jgi:hypothetical protein
VFPVRYGLNFCIVACRAYATTTKWADIQGPFLGNGSVNTFPQEHTRTQQYKSYVFYVVLAELL